MEPSRPRGNVRFEVDGEVVAVFTDQLVGWWLDGTLLDPVPDETF